MGSQRPGNGTGFHPSKPNGFTPGMGLDNGPNTLIIHGFHNILIFSRFKIPLERFQKLKREFILW